MYEITFTHIKHEGRARVADGGQVSDGEGDISFAWSTAAPDGMVVVVVGTEERELPAALVAELVEELSAALAERMQETRKEAQS